MIEYSDTPTESYVRVGNCGDCGRRDLTELAFANHQCARSGRKTRNVTLSTDALEQESAHIARARRRPDNQRRASGISPDMARAHRWMDSVRRVEGKQFQKLDPAHKGALQAARHALDTGDVQGARQHLSRVLADQDLHPAHRDRLERADHALSVNDGTDAWRHVSHVLAANTDDGEHDQDHDDLVRWMIGSAGDPLPQSKASSQWDQQLRSIDRTLKMVNYESKAAAKRPEPSLSLDDVHRAFDAVRRGEFQVAAKYVRAIKNDFTASAVEQLEKGSPRLAIDLLQDQHRLYNDAGQCSPNTCAIYAKPSR